MSKITLYDGYVLQVRETFKEISTMVTYRGDSGWLILHDMGGAEFAINIRHILMIHPIGE